MGICAIIVSKDRACQLDALIQSMNKYAPGIFDINIIYKQSNDFYQAGYNRLSDLTEDEDINWIYEDTFRTSIIQAVQNSDSKCCILLTDDSIFFDDFTFNDITLFSFFEQYNCKTFSPRCGFNTKQQCHWEPIFQREIEPIYDLNDIIIWDFMQHDFSTDYGRPVSLDGNIHPRELLLDSMINSEWTWCSALDGMNREKFLPHMASYKHSILTNVPVNSTHGAIANNWGKYYTFTFEELNQAFLDGKRININKLDFSKVNGAHSEIEYIIE